MSIKWKNKEMQEKNQISARKKALELLKEQV